MRDAIMICIAIFATGAWFGFVFPAMFIKPRPENKFSRGEIRVIGNDVVRIKSGAASRKRGAVGAIGIKSGEVSYERGAVGATGPTGIKFGAIGRPDEELPPFMQGRGPFVAWLIFSAVIGIFLFVVIRYQVIVEFHIYCCGDKLN